MKESISSVNATQMALKKWLAYERGEEIPLTDVVLAMQKSSLAEATLQVRNKVLKHMKTFLICQFKWENK